MKKSKILFAVFSTAISLFLTSCDFLTKSFNYNTTENSFTITKSGLKEDKYLSGKIDNKDYLITLIAKNGTLSAQKDTQSRSANLMGTYTGSFVYDTGTKTLYMQLKGSNISYKKAESLDLTGTKGSEKTAPVSFTLSSSTKDEFTAEVEIVKALEEDSGDTEDPDDTNESGGTVDQEDPEDINDIIAKLPPAPNGKTYSNYVDGIRYINFGAKADPEDVVFTPKIKPLPKPDFSAIDNAVKNLDIDSSKYSIEEAGKLIVQTAGAKTIKEKARAIYSWICYHVDYDESYSKYTAEDAYYDRCAVCDGYSRLVAQMCAAVNVEAPKWVGLVVSMGKQGKIIENHAWNRVCINKEKQQYFVLDATWGSDGTLNNNKSMSDWWFDPDPCLFVTSHWSEEGGALISPAINRDAFMKLPIIDVRLGEIFDGKELLEFCYAHDISTVIHPAYLKDAEYYKIPISETLIRGHEYEIAYEKDGSYNEIHCEVTSDTNVGFQSFDGIYYTLADNIESTKLGETEIADATFIYYDDQVEYIPPIYDSQFSFIPPTTVHDIGNWRVSVPDFANEKRGTINFNSPDVQMSQTYSSAEFDSVFQEWTFIKGHYLSTYNDFKASFSGYSSLKDFDEDPETMIKNVIIKIDPRIDLSRTGDYRDRDYNEVYIPLSKKEEAENAVVNYDWTADEEFAKFVRWMQSHNIPQNQIDFYIKMAKFPFQRGKNISTQEDSRFAGPDYKTFSVDDNENAYVTGGMQKFFEFRKHEERHLFNNETIPILMIHIKDADKKFTEQPPANFFEDEEENIKSKLSGAGLKNNFEVYFVEIEMSYSDISKNLKKDDWMYIRPWVQYSVLWDEALAKVAEKNPALAKKFEDKTKSAIIKYFDNVDLNGKIGNINGEYHVKSRLDNIMQNIGYSRGVHMSIFGSEMKYHSPQCYDVECVRDVAICPLCLYSFNID